MRAKLLILLTFWIFSLSTAAQEQPINTVDSEGKRHGTWKEYYDINEQQLKFEGEFVHGKEIGVFKFYQKGLKQPAAIMEFDPASDIVEAKFLTQQGKTISEGQMLNQVRTGLWIYYHKNSDEVMMTETYEHGKLNGLKTIYYPNGKMAETANYLDGELHGTRKLYSEKGVVLEDLQYVKGELHGPGKFYNGKGELMSEGLYKHNKHHGTWRYYEHGKLVREKDF